MLPRRPPPRPPVRLQPSLPQSAGQAASQRESGPTPAALRPAGGLVRQAAQSPAGVEGGPTGDRASGSVQLRHQDQTGLTGRAGGGGGGQRNQTTATHSSAGRKTTCVVRGAMGARKYVFVRVPWVPPPVVSHPTPFNWCCSAGRRRAVWDPNAACAQPTPGSPPRPPQGEPVSAGPASCL